MHATVWLWPAVRTGRRCRDNADGVDIDARLLGSFLSAWLLFPLVLLAASVGCGLLVRSVAGGELSRLLVAPVGFALVVVICAFATSYGWLTQTAAPIVVLAAVAGYLLEARSGGFGRTAPALGWRLGLAAPGRTRGICGGRGAGVSHGERRLDGLHADRRHRVPDGLRAASRRRRAGSILRTGTPLTTSSQPSCSASAIPGARRRRSV